MAKVGLLNVEGKIFFDVVAPKQSAFLQCNNIVYTKQKKNVPHEILWAAFNFFQVPTGHYKVGQSIPPGPEVLRNITGPHGSISRRI